MPVRELLFFEPYYKNVIWGGNKMKTTYGYNLPTETVGEAWVISALENGDCVCVSKSFKGRTLSDLWKNEPELFGYFGGERFPLLLKVIDAKKEMSIQVHPDDEYAMKNENGSTGKTECWYILDCDPGAKLILGHNAKTREELFEMIDQKRFSELIREVDIKKGDFIMIEPGTVHSLKGGVMLFETQQNSGITYRVYDYDRLWEGKPRELHVDKAKDVILVPPKDGRIGGDVLDAGMFTLGTCNYYTVSKINVDGEFILDKEAPFRTVFCSEGSGSVDGVPIKGGDSFIIPNGYGKLVFSGKMSLIVSVPESM